MGLASCTLCPRACAADRTSTRGFCGAPREIHVASVCVHRGEEPALNPIINIFYAHCNLQCIYCQNHQISGRCVTSKQETPETIADLVCDNLTAFDGNNSTPLVGFVTAAHYADSIPDIIAALHRRGIKPVFVYNSSGYESVSTLRTLEGLIDIYLPDLKYLDPDIAAKYSHAPDYPEIATAAILEMKRQVGSSLKVDDSGTAYRGLIVRHLVLPGHTGNTIRCLDWLADNFNPFSLHLSLMAQYYPPTPELPVPINRTLTDSEYSSVVDHAAALGFTSGWIQELQSSENYRPDFTNDNKPFK